MRTIVSWLGMRLLPAVMTAAGVTLVVAGLLSYGGLASGADASPPSSPRPSASPANGSGDSSTPTPSPTLVPFPSVAAATPMASLPSPTASAATPSPRPSTAVVTRVVVPALDIDLPVIKPSPDESFPPCNVAEYFVDPHFGSPGTEKVVYLYAHAREGMFLPLLTASQVDNGSRMLGMVVEVYTSDDQVFLYQIGRVRRHVNVDGALNAPFSVTRDQLWLQTSEGPLRESTKLQVIADPISSGPAVHEDAHPTPKPVTCG